MKGRLILGLIFLFLVGISYSQSKERKVKVYKAWITKLGGEKTKGFLLDADSSNVSLLYNLESDINNPLHIPISTIDEIKIRRKNKVLKGAGIGAASGIVLGLIIGYSKGDDKPCTPPPDRPFDCIFDTERSAGEKATTNAIGLGLLGGITGALVGTKREKFNIGGKQDVYLRNLQSLRQYTISMQEQ